MSACWRFWLALAALVSCLLPWVINPGAGLSLNPVDLAEWTSLSPTIQAQSPSLLTTFLLRTPLLMVALLVGLATFQSTRLWAALLILLLAAAQLPPFEFLNALDNANYQQQALLAGLTGAGGIICLVLIPRACTELASVAIAGLGLAAAAIAVASAVHELHAIGLPAPLGPGLALYGVVLTLVLTAGMLPGIKKRRAKTPPSEIIQAGSD